VAAVIFNSWTLKMLPRLGILRHLRGTYRTWDQAAARSTGYASSDVYEQTLRAARMVRDGKAQWQRDSVTFGKVEFSWPVMAELARQAAQRTCLNVLDVGGGLGSSYLQYKAFAPNDSRITWTIVELPEIAEAGEREFSTGQLRFTSAIPERESAKPDIVLLSSVLQYLRDAELVVGKLLALSPSSVILDRTPISSIGFYSVQRVPRRIYKADYPIRVFSEREISEMFRSWTMLHDFPSYCDNPGKLFRGRIYSPLP
jgi:putative methyltransferase (TIGR04325 family)